MPGYHKKKNKQKKAHHNGEPHDHPHKKKQKLKERLAKIGADNKRGDVDVDKNEQYKSVESNEYYNKHDADMGGYNKDILDKVQLKNQKKVKKGKKVPQDRIPRSPNKDNNFQTRINKPLEQRALKEKQKKAELSDVTKEQKKKKGKERLVHKASKGVDTYSSQDPKNSKVKKKRVKGKIAKNRQLEALKKKLNKMKPPQGPSGGTADTPESIIKDAEAVAKTPSYIAKDHDHSITFKGYKGESYKRASLISTTGKYAKYWLLNAKQTNGNGWGVSQQSIAKNIHKFVGKPLVVTAKSWIPNSEYGDAYEHPYLPTNDINKVFDHQEKFRVGSIVDIIEKDGDYFANIEINQKFAHMVMPPFCSPAIFQNNPSEPEGQISDWEALHLAALHEDPAYGSRIALLRGTCVGTQDQCTVQFKAAKQEAKVICTKDLKGRLATLKKNDLKSKLATFRNKGAKPPEENADVIQGAFNVIEGQDAATLGINDKKYKNIDLKVRDYGEKARTEHREIGPIEGGVFAPEDEPPHPFPKDVEELVTKDVGEPEMLFGPESPTGEDMIRRDERMVPATFEYIKEKYKDSLDYIIGEDGNPVKFEIGDDRHRYMGDRSQPDSVANEGDYFSLENEKPLGIGAGAPVETRAKRQESLEEARQLVRSYIPGVKDMSNKKIDELLAYITRNDISSFNDIQVMDISNENAQRWSKLKQRIAGIQQTAFAGPPKDVIAAFREKKPLKFREKIKGRNKEYAFQTDGKTLYQSGFPIAQHTKNGIKFSYQSHPSATTAQAGRMLGINTFTKKGKTYVNGKEIDPNTDDYIEVPTKDIQEGTFKVNPNSTPVITEDKVKRNRDQEYFRNKSEKEALAGNQDLVVQTHKKKEVLDHGSITPEEQATINKITGLRNRAKRVYATDYHHSLPAEKGGGIGGGIFNRRITSGAVPLSKKTHMEAHFPEKTIPKSFYSKLKQRLALEGGVGGVRKYWLYPDGKISEDVRWHDKLHFNDEGQMRDKGGVKITNEQGKYDNYFGVGLRQHLTPAQKSHIKQELKDYGFYRNKGNVTFDHGDNKNNTVDSTTKDFGDGFAHSYEHNQKPIGSQKISKLKQRLAYIGGTKYDKDISKVQENFQGMRKDITGGPSSLRDHHTNIFDHQCTNEATCGKTSGKLLTDFITNTGLSHKDVSIEGGLYKGPGGEYSPAVQKKTPSGEPQVKHEWLKLSDGTIIDGSSGQFMNQKNEIRQNQRFRVIRPSDPLYKSYEGKYSQSFAEMSGGRRNCYNKKDPMRRNWDKTRIQVHDTDKLRAGKLKQRLSRLEE